MLCPNWLQGPPSQRDEVDASPEEQFVRHHIKWPDEQGAASAGSPGAPIGSTAGTSQHPSALQRVRETVVSHPSVSRGLVWGIAPPGERLPQVEYSPVLATDTPPCTSHPAGDNVLCVSWGPVCVQVHAAEGVTHRLEAVAERLHLVGPQGQAEGQQQQRPTVPPKGDTTTPAVPEGTAEQRTGTAPGGAADATIIWLRPRTQLRGLGIVSCMPCMLC